MKWLEYQQKWIDDQSRLKILEKSRRIGGTYSTSYGVFKELMAKKGHDIIVISRDETLSTEFVANVARWIHMWNAIMPSGATIDKKYIKRLSIEIPHAGGSSRLIAVSSNPNAAAGKGGSLYIDELALHNDPELLMTVAQPIITAGGNLSILSTHRSRNSLFNRLVMEARKPESEWSLHSTTIYDAVDQGFVEQVVNPTMIKNGNEPYEKREDFIDWLKETYDEFTFAQEFCCIPADDACSLLSFKEVRDAIELREKGSIDHGMYYLGYDSAESLHGDYAAICVIRASMQEAEIVETYYFPRGTPIATQLDTVVGYAKRYKCDKIVSDNAGIGRHPTTILKGRLGESRVVAFDPTMKSKEEACVKVKRYFQNGWIRMEADKQVEDDFLSIDRVITNSGNIVYQAVRQNHSHGDMFSAMMMAMTQAPERRQADLTGVSNAAPKAYDGNDEGERIESIRDRIARNKKLDDRARKRFTY